LTGKVVTGGVIFCHPDVGEGMLENDGA